MGKVQTTVEEVSRSQVFRNGYNASFHYEIKVKYSDATRHFCMMKVKTTNEVRELIGNMSLNEYRAHTEEEATPKKKCMIDLNAQDDLLANNKLLSI